MAESEVGRRSGERVCRGGAGRRDPREFDEPCLICVDPLVIPDGPLLSRRSRDEFGPSRIPDGRYFMMGDNRDETSESRY